MILTDKAKSDFLEWYGSDERYFETTATKTEEYANVCEWLDALPSSVIGGNSFSDILYVALNTMKYKEAIKHSIKTSNQWYNSQDFAQCEYCTCDFVTVKRDTKTDKGYCNECNKEVKE